MEADNRGNLPQSNICFRYKMGRQRCYSCCHCYNCLCPILQFFIITAPRLFQSPFGSWFGGGGGTVLVLLYFSQKEMNENTFCPIFFMCNILHNFSLVYILLQHVPGIAVVYLKSTEEEDALGRDTPQKPHCYHTYPPLQWSQADRGQQNGERNLSPGTGER